MMSDGLTAADVMAITKGNDDGYGAWMNNPFIYLVWLALLGGGGIFGNRYGQDAAMQGALTRSDLFEGFNNQDVNSQLRGITNGLCDGFYAVNNSLKDGFYGNQAAVKDGFYGTQSSISDLGYSVKDCCCTTNRNIDAVRYENALNTASINANTTAGVQRILDQLCADKAAAQAARINQLELQQALCGVVRYPLATTYTAGYPFSCGCGFNQNI